MACKFFFSASCDWSNVNRFIQKKEKRNNTPFTLLFSQEIRVNNYITAGLLQSENKKVTDTYGGKAFISALYGHESKKVWPCFLRWSLDTPFGTRKQSKGWSLFAYIHDVSSISLARTLLEISLSLSLLSLSRFCWHACCKST